MSPPLVPHAEEARRMLEAELARPEYADPGGWFSDLFDRFLDWLVGDPVTASGLSDSQVLGIVLTAAFLVGLAIWAFMGPLRQDRRARAVAVLVHEERSATQLRQDAVRLADAGEWGPATMQLFRAIVRSLGERTIIDETPGMTAHEAAGRAADRLPAAAPGLVAGADVFDALAYGDRPGDPVQYEQLLALDAELAGLRPVPVPVPVTVTG